MVFSLWSSWSSYVEARIHWLNSLSECRSTGKETKETMHQRKSGRRAAFVAMTESPHTVGLLERFDLSVLSLTYLKRLSGFYCRTPLARQ